MSNIKELEAKLTALQTEIAALKAQPDEIDWGDPKWVGRLVEVRDSDKEEWRLMVCAGGEDGFCRTRTGLWQQARPYTGPTRPNWIEWRGGECPVDEGDWVIVQFRNGCIAARRRRQFSWHWRASMDDIMRYSVVVP